MGYKCLKCGNVMEDGYKFCIACGEPVGLVSAEEGKGAKEEKIQQKKVSPPKPDGWYVYAKYISKKDASITFKSVDNRFFFQSASFIERALPDLKPGAYAWFYQEDLNSKTARYIEASPKSLTFEAKSFRKHYNIGDEISLPIIQKNDNKLKVAMGPTLFTFVEREDIPIGIDYDSFNVDQIYKFALHEMKNEDGRLIVKLQPVGKYDDSSTTRTLEKIPDSLGDIMIPGSTLDRLRNDSGLRLSLESAIRQEFTAAALKDYIETHYQKQRREKTLVVRQNHKGIRIDVDLDIRDSNGVPLRACINKNAGRDDFYLAMIGVTDPGPEMERYVFIEDWAAVTKELSELALPESWDYKNDKKGNRRILAQYLRYNFYKAILDGCLHEEGEDAIFNTGLVDSSYDDIYCYLKKNNRMNDPFERRWIIGFFACRGKGVDGKELNRRFTSFPDAPVYIRQDQLTSIFFDTTKELSCDYTHIIEDNMDRIPLDFISHQLAFDTELQKKIKAGRPMKEIKTHIVGNPELVRTLESALKNATETAEKYCKWNYKTAIPIYYPRTNNISLLLPLKLTGNKSIADIALVIEKLDNGNYQGQTILTLDMAYQDARQICRPNSEWLTFDSIEETNEEEDEDENQ